ncbi:MAG: hypothetical protein ACMUHY_04560 [Thermoplasmatota archaeon]
MDLLVLDILYGILFILGISVSVAGALIYRYRRDKGPLLLAVSGSFGMMSSILFVIDSSNAARIPIWLPLSCLLLFIVLILVSLSRWRGGR